MAKVICDYCNSKVKLVKGDKVHPEISELHDQWFYVCTNCFARVGCHKNSKRPLGRLADAKLRRYRKMAHDSFDALWKSKLMKRQAAYEWLAKRLGIPKSKCHIGNFDTDTCEKVVILSENHLVSVREIRKALEDGQTSKTDAGTQ